MKVKNIILWKQGIPLNPSDNQYFVNKIIFPFQQTIRTSGQSVGIQIGSQSAEQGNIITLVIHKLTGDKDDVETKFPSKWFDMLFL